jgi:hypothetical protein
MLKGTSSVPIDKPRGANRSTKLGGKLKVLPEQPVLEDEPSNVQVSQKGYAESSGTNRDSDEGDGGESEEESQEDDVEVRRVLVYVLGPVLQLAS